LFEITPKGINFILLFFVKKYKNIAWAPCGETWSKSNYTLGRHIAIFKGREDGLAGEFGDGFLPYLCNNEKCW
jgi:hypothetical protein